VLQLSTEEQVVGALRGYRNPDAVAIHVLDPLQRRTRRQQVRAFELDVSRREVDVVGTERVDRQVSDVPGIAPRTCADLAGGIVWDELERDADASRQLS
jgi:hypothetical protein